MDTDDAPPPLLLKDDPAAADAARHRIQRKSSALAFLRKRRTSHSPSPPPLPASPSRQSLQQSDVPILLDGSALVHTKAERDKYEWAVVYENQRGMTVFSIPYYSSASLLPTDPLPFTLPNASPKRSKQPPISLENFPLPDGNWQWVSRVWMIDMRSDSGEVQHDGFEYNWSFRNRGWRAQIGSFNAGGWVRRRRWIRLMVLPAKPRKSEVNGDGSLVSTPDKRMSLASSQPSSLRSGVSDPWSNIDPSEVWLSEPAENWRRCRKLMSRLATDGQKLEIWRLWFGVDHPDYKDKFLTVSPKRREKQWTEDDYPLPSEVAASTIPIKEFIAPVQRQYIIPVLRGHYQQILLLFMFPESRAEFIKLLGKADLLKELDNALGTLLGASEVDFFSYANGLANRFNAEASLQPIIRPSPRKQTLSIPPSI